MRPFTIVSIILSFLSYATAYDLVRTWQGENFFDGWEFYGAYDNLTLGNVTFVNRTYGEEARLTYVGDNGNVILKIDNTTNVRDPDLRNAVYITTEDAFEVGSVFAMSAVHMPYGCSVWPAFFTQGPTWPEGGEIDILETINLRPSNQYAIHTSEGCTINNTAAIEQTGETTATDCMTSAFEGTGCTTIERNNNSVGAAFNRVGGGVYAAEMAESGINIWFFEHADIPPEIVDGDTIDTSTWGTPSASYPSTNCDINRFFGPQRMTLDITLCGNFAGGVAYETTGCEMPPDEVNTFAVCYDQNVAGDGSNYAQAYWEIEWVKVFGSPEAAASMSSILAEESSATATDSPSESVQVDQPGHATSTYVFTFGAFVPALISFVFFVVNA